jgi:hypothetical protein
MASAWQNGFIELNLAKVGVVGSNPIARSKNSLYFKACCACESVRFRQVSAERSTKIPRTPGKIRGLRLSRLRKSAQDDKWSFCLTAGTLCPANQERQ